MTSRVLHSRRDQQKQDLKQSADPSQDQDETQPSVHLPLKLSPFVASSSLSDITLMVGSSVFHAHKLILSSWSPVFKEMLLKRSNSDEPYVLEDAQEYEVIFSDFLKFMYTEIIEISKDTVYSFHKLSNKYKVDEICELCEEFLIGEISNDTIALQALTNAEEFGFTKVYDHCFKFLETNFFRLSDSSLKKMSPSLFLLLLKSSDLVVKSESQVLQKGFDWLHTGGAQRQEKYTEDVISKIRFVYMSFSELSILKSELPTRPHLDDSSKQCLLRSLSDAFEWKALVSCENDELKLLPNLIRTTLSIKNSVDPRFYTAYNMDGYQTLYLSESLQNKLEYFVTGVYAYNIVPEPFYQWCVTGSKLYDKNSKKWKICYRFKPDEEHMNHTYHLVILTSHMESCNDLKSLVTTSKGVLKDTEVKVEQVLPPTKLAKELQSVQLKALIRVTMSKFDYMREQSHQLSEFAAELSIGEYGPSYQ
ncbi:uncharacterized protein [Asterias amurensis]